MPPDTTPIRKLAQDLERRLAAYIPTPDEANALRSLRNEINQRLMAAPPRDGTPRYAIGIDHGTDPSTSVVAQIEAGNITWVVDEPGDVDDGPRVTDRSGPLPGTHMAEQAFRRYGEWIRRMEMKPTVIKSSSPLAFDDDELDEEERGVPTPWSSTWDG